MSLCSHNVNLKHQRCGTCEEVAAAEHKTRCREMDRQGGIKTMVRDCKWVAASFVAAMERQLVANEYKGDWTKWKPDAIQLCDELDYHCKKLVGAIMAVDLRNSEPSDVSITSAAANLANLCMKAAEMAKALGDDRP